MSRPDALVQNAHRQSPLSDVVWGMTPSNIAEELGKSGLCICPRFLSPQTLRETADDLDRLRTAGSFERAGTGQGLENTKGGGIRSDETYWFDRELENPAQELIWEKLDLLRQAFNRTLFLGITGFEGHYSAYPKGGFYKRHKDSFRADSKRIVSLIVYLNRDWKSADGGQLRIYDGDSYTDIDPVGGTMVCFMSRESEHEVMPSHQERFSFCGWFKVRQQLIFP